MSDAPKDSDSKFLAPSVIAALVWLSLSLYMFLVVPKQVDLESHMAKPDQMRAAMPPLMNALIRFHEWRGTAILAGLGILGCGLAYMRRSAVLANIMILIGALSLTVLIWAVLSSLPK